MFFITCFTKIAKHKLGWLDMGSIRTFGFLETFEEAEQALNENACDMRECLYDYAVVEEMQPGIHPTAFNRWFYKFDEERKGFYRIEEPEEFQHYCNIALG